MAVTFDKKLVRDLDGTNRCDPADIIASKIEQHEVLGAFLRICHQFVFERLVLVRRCAALACTGDRADRDDIARNFYENFGTRSATENSPKSRK